MFTVVLLPASTCAARTSVRKPCISARTSYSPAGSAGALYRPSSLAVRVRALPVALFVTVRIALGTTAPDSSVTVPEIMPVAVCAESVAAATSGRTINRDSALRIDPPLRFELAQKVFRNDTPPNGKHDMAREGSNQ